MNQSLLIINELALYDVKPIIANFSNSYSLNMAQFSVRGAGGFVLADDTAITLPNITILAETSCSESAG